MKDILKQLFGDAVTDDVLKQFNAELGKKFVAKADYNAKLEVIKGLEDGKKKLEDSITELTEKADNNADYKKQLEDLQKEIKAKEDAELTDAITAVFGDKKFTSDYVRNGIIADMKAEIAKPENKGKGYTEIFEALTKEKEGIFANPNPGVEIPGMGKIDTSSITKEQFAKMGYLERNKLYNENRELYNQLKE